MLNTAHFASFSIFSLSLFGLVWDSVNWCDRMRPNPELENLALIYNIFGLVWDSFNQCYRMRPNPELSIFRVNVSRTHQEYFKSGTGILGQHLPL